MDQFFKIVNYWEGSWKGGHISAIKREAFQLPAIHLRQMEP